MASVQFGSGGGFSGMIDRSSATWQEHAVTNYLNTASISLAWLGLWYHTMCTVLKYIDLVPLASPAPCPGAPNCSILYRVKYIDPVSVAPLCRPPSCQRRATTSPPASAPHLDLSRAPYILYGVYYIDLVSLDAPFSIPCVFLRSWPVAHTLTCIVPPICFVWC